MALKGNKSFLFVFIQVKSLIKRNFDETTRISRLAPKCLKMC